jgi:hypothetical protein
VNTINSISVWSVLFDGTIRAHSVRLRPVLLPHVPNPMTKLARSMLTRG